MEKSALVHPEFDDNSVIEKCARPFLKWAGGKTQIISELLKRVPRSINSYHEPFLGGGALYFSLGPKRAILSDINAELINTYTVVRDRVEELIRELKRHRYESDYYYEIRGWDRATGFKALSPVQRAGRLIFLNKTCFNGLYRVNSKGEFNVPFGRYSNPKILDPDNLRACSRVLKTAEIHHGNYLAVEERAGEGDFVYFDPPYAPVSRTANFTTYSSEGFSEEDQYALRDLCRRLDEKRVKFMLSNSATPFTRKLFEGFKVSEVEVGRAINSKASSRGKVYEIVVTNYASK